MENGRSARVAQLHEQIDGTVNVRYFSLAAF